VPPPPPLVVALAKSKIKCLLLLLGEKFPRALLDAALFQEIAECGELLKRVCETAASKTAVIKLDDQQRRRKATNLRKNRGRTALSTHAVLLLLCLLGIPSFHTGYNKQWREVNF
jgi:hypothetical protein